MDGRHGSPISLPRQLHIRPLHANPDAQESHIDGAWRLLDRPVASATAKGLGLARKGLGRWVGLGWVYLPHVLGATCLRMTGYDIRMVQRLADHADVSPTMIFTHAFYKGGAGTLGPPDALQNTKARHRAFVCFQAAAPSRRRTSTFRRSR